MSFNKIYTYILSNLSLTPEHLDNLIGRGISEQNIRANGYKSWPYKRRDLVSRCVAEFGEQSLLGVPGFWKDDTGRVQLSGVSGIAIPVRDANGKIEGIKLRPDKPADPTSKYVHLSSNPEPNKKTHEVKYPNGTAAKVMVHFPQGGGDQAGRDIRVTEGELKADVSTLLSPTYTISVPGVGLWENAMPELEKLKPGRVIISYDADKSNQVGPYNNKPFEVGVHLAEFYMALKANGYTVVIEDWPKECGKGIDDVLADGHGDKVCFLSDAQADEFCKKTGASASMVSAEWVYIIGIQRFVNVETGQELTKDQFKDKFWNKSKKKCPVEEALKSSSFTRLDFPEYKPGGEKIIVKSDTTTGYNYWRGAGIQAEEGDVGPFLEHCSYMLPNPDECRMFLDYLCWIVQRPGEKIHWAVLLQGVQGTGKSYFGHVMELVLGVHNVSTPSNEELHETYTGWQRNCQVVVVEELMARGKLDLMNKLKPMITQPRCVIREMYKPTYMLDNHFNLLLLTNHEDSIVIDEHDRRYCVLYSPAKPRTKQYYTDLWDWSDANAGRILHFMRTRDLTEFSAKGHAPKTKARKELIRMSASPLKSWIVEGVESESWPFMGDIITTAHLVQCVPQYIRGANPNLLGRILNEIGAKQLTQTRLSSGERVRPWSIRRHEVWESAEKDTISHEIERWCQSKEPGGNPLLEAKPM